MSSALRTVSSAYRSTLGRIGLLAPRRRPHADRASPSGRRGRRLFRKYVLLLVGLVGLVLLVDTGLHFWFSYSEDEAAALGVQQEMAKSAARRIEEFIDEIEHQLGWTTAPQWAAAPVEQRQFDFVRLLRQAPAITELIQLDGNGKEQLRVSRLAMDVVGSGKDYSQEPSFTEAKKHRVWFSAVYFRKESEPYLTLSMAQAGHNAGVTIAEVNLKLIWDVISGMKIGEGGYAYVIDRNGRLIAHPDISLVLRDTDLTDLPQVAAARAEAQADQIAPAAMVAKNINGEEVLTAHAPVVPLGWTVFVELPMKEALAPLYRSMMQSAALLALALVLAGLAALFLARRMVGPIRLLQAGAARIGAGELDRRIDIHTGDELEELAGEFNRMAGDLQKSYAELEQKVEDRTAELKEALDQQTATAEVLGVINSSPGDLAPIFDAMLEKAIRLCGGMQGVLWTIEGERGRIASAQGVPSEFVISLNASGEAGTNPILRRIIRGEHVIQIIDVTGHELYLSAPFAGAALEAGVRTLIWVALVREGAPTGAFAIARREVRPFTEKQIALLQNFAAQAVIAMENARLLTETREALERQTATAEVLGVINSSPGDLAPVFDAILDEAMWLCDASCGYFLRRQNGIYTFAAGRGLTAELAQYMAHMDQPGAEEGAGQILEGKPYVHIVDGLDDDAYRSGAPLRRAVVDLGGLRTGLNVPLRKDNDVLGTLALGHREVRPFTEKQIALVQNFAAQAVIAMENARLLGELRQRTDDLQESLEYQTATSDVLKVVSRSAFDLDTVLQTVVTTAVRLCRADSATIHRNVDGEYRWAAGHMLLPDYEQIERNVRIRPGTGTLVGRAVSEARTVEILDAWTDPLYEVKEDARVGGVHTMIGVPLLREGAPIGVIGLARRRIEAFSEREIQLVTTFADQAVIAIENARLVSELRQRTHDLQESLEYQTATSDVLKVISQSTFDLQPVLTTLTETAARLCDAEMAFIFRRRGDLYRVSASVGFSPETKALVEANPISPGRGTVAGRTALTASVVHIPDARLDPEYTWGEFLRVAKTPTLLGVPLLREGVPVGVIVLARQRMQPFSDKQIQLVRTFADQAVIAIENARLFNELRERTAELGRSVEELKMLSEVGQAVSSTLDLRTVLSAVLTASLGVTWANAGAIFRYSRAERAFRLAEAMGWDETLASSVREMRVAETGSAMGEAAARRMPIQLPDIAQTATPLRDLTLAAGFRSALIIPLLGAERILGAIILMRQEAGEFPRETVRLMQTLASQSVLAIQNARMFREIADKSEQLALASQHKSQFLANMSHELRTPLNAILGYAELLVDGIYGALADRPRGVLERIQNNGKHLLALINDVLDLAKIEAGQLTLTLEDYSLPEVVKAVVTATEPLATSKGLKFTAALQDSLPTGHGDARRLSQVLLNLVGNAIKFTDEGEVEIRAALEKGQFVLTVRDTGPGIPEADQERIFGEFQQIDNSSTRQRGGTGLGLAISKRMVEMQGGTISVDSVLGQGSTFRVVLPVQVDEMMEEAA